MKRNLIILGLSVVSMLFLNGCGEDQLVTQMKKTKLLDVPEFKIVESMVVDDLAKNLKDVNYEISDATIEGQNVKKIIMTGKIDWKQEKDAKPQNYTHTDFVITFMHMDDTQLSKLKKDSFEEKFFKRFNNQIIVFQYADKDKNNGNKAINSMRLSIQDKGCVFGNKLSEKKEDLEVCFKEAREMIPFFIDKASKNK